MTRIEVWKGKELLPPEDSGNDDGGGLGVRVKDIVGIPAVQKGGKDREEDSREQRVGRC